MKPYEALLALWAAERRPYSRDVTHGEAEVAALEARYGVQLPSDFRDYMLHACATCHDSCPTDDGQFGAWWGLDRIRSVREEYPYTITDAGLEQQTDTALFFAVWAMAWAICCRPGPSYGQVYVVSDEDRVVAPTFAAFVEQYVIDSTALI